jgi:CubicO group peptidase (beta-lactamase class C family)
MIYPGRDFEKASCRDASVDKSLLIDMFDKIRDDKLNIHQMVLLRDGAKIFDVYADSFGPASREEIWSISKSFTSLAIGICQDLGLLSIDDAAVRFFSSSVPNPTEAQKAIKIRHLLTMSVGHSKDGFDDAKNVKDPYAYFFELPLTHTPGTYFFYNNFASFLLSAIVTKVTRLSVNDFLDEKIYQKIGIVKPTWLAYDGVSLGAYGLQLGSLDLARFGHLCMNEGVWQGDSLVSRAYMREAMSFQIATAHVDNPRDRYGYGYQFWINDFGDARAAGWLKQYIVIHREFGIVFVVQACEDREILNLFSSYVLPAFFKGWQYTPDSIRDYLYRFTADSKAIIAEEKAKQK